MGRDIGGWTAATTGAATCGGALRADAPSVTDFRVMPWYDPIVSILKPSVSAHVNQVCNYDKLTEGNCQHKNVIYIYVLSGQVISQWRSLPKQVLLI